MAPVGLVILSGGDDQVIHVRAPGNYWADEHPVPLPAASFRGAWEPLADPRFADASPLLDNDQLVTAPLSNLGDVARGTTTFFEGARVIELSTVGSGRAAATAVDVVDVFPSPSATPSATPSAR